MPVRVLIADDHPQFRAVVAETLEDAGITVCAEAAAGDAAEKLALEHRPDVCLLDIRMPGDGIATARRIARALPGTRVLMLTVSADSDDVLDALQAGADGYLVKGMPLDEIPRAVHAVVAGDAVIAPTVTAAVVREVRRSREGMLRLRSGDVVQLTDREWQILELLERGNSTAAMAGELRVAPVTVRTHVAALVRKLGARDRRDAVAIFRRGR